MRILFLLITILFFCPEIKGQDTITLLCYNILNFPNPSNTNPLGDDDARVIYFREIIEESKADLILVQELRSDAGANLLLNELNDNSTIGKTFGRAPVYFGYGNSSASMLGNMLFYNTEKFSFISQLEVPSLNAATTQNGNTVWTPRPPSYYELEAYAADCPTWTIPLHLFTMHLKGGSSGASNSSVADRDRRVLGAQDLMDFINSSLTNSDNIIATGDFNFYSYLANNVNNSNYDEPAYDVLMDVTSNTNPLVDPVGAWERNDAATSNVCKYTQSTRDGNFNEFGNSGAPGGLDDRFDFILMNQAVDNATNGISYVEGSNNPYGSAKVLNGNATSSSHPLVDQIHQMSDHYPVVAQFVLDIPSNILSIMTNPIPTNTYRAFDQIISDGLVPTGNDVVFKAANEISLDSGFCVEAGADFLAEIEDVCQ